jgi:hypothetical protein
LAQVVCVHGIAQEFEVAETMETKWVPALIGGVRLAGGSLKPADVAMVAYGMLFRKGEGWATKGDDGDLGTVPDLPAGDLFSQVGEVVTPEDLDQLPDEVLEDEGLVAADVGFEGPADEAFLRAWLQLAAHEEAMAHETKGFVGSLMGRPAAVVVQGLGHVPVLGPVTERMAVWFLVQVRRYLGEERVRKFAQDAVREQITGDTRVLVGHSLGSVVAYEVLCSDPDLPVRTLVTLGSPLGVRAVRSRLQPPVINGRGAWPSGVEHWVNIADKADPVALKKRLDPIFGTDNASIEDIEVFNGGGMHDVKPYLTSKRTGEAIWSGLSSK